MEDEDEEEDDEDEDDDSVYDFASKIEKAKCSESRKRVAIKRNANTFPAYSQQCFDVAMGTYMEQSG